MECWEDGDGQTPPLLHRSNSVAMLAMTEGNNESLLARELKQLAGLKLKTAEPLARYTSMKIGGPADYFIEVANETALAKLLPALKRHRCDFYLLGNGSNILISDRGVRGAVIRLGEEFKTVQWREAEGAVHASVGAGYAVTQLVREASRRGYAGLEFAEGIPGTVGGALYMNAGAYGSEFEKVVEVVEAMTSDGQPMRLTREQMTFGYRDSHLPAGTVVTRVTMRLQKAEATRVSSKVRELTSRRKDSQPSGFPNSGSMFRNPSGDYAGRLIEAAGLKGKRIGQSQISDRHANFFINLGGAKAAEVRQLMALAQAEVRRRFGVELVPEVKFLGDWPAD